MQVQFSLVSAEIKLHFESRPAWNAVWKYAM